MSVPAVRCKATSKQSGKQCRNWAIKCGEVCRLHGGSAPAVKAKAAVRAELMDWSVGDAVHDPGETLLRLVTQSCKRTDLYAQLLQEAFEAAERLKQAHDAGTQIDAPEDELADTAETARRDLDRIFNTGGVAALVGNTYGAAKDVGVYITGEAIRGLADLEAKERSGSSALICPPSERCPAANCTDGADAVRCQSTMSETPHAMWQTFADLLDPPENQYISDPVGWVSDRLGEFLWSKQREIIEAVVRHRYVAVKSAHDTGKSHSASRAVAWWLGTREDPFATTTAPTTKQVHAILWRYIGQAHRKGNLSGRTLDDEWYLGSGGKELVAFGRKPADTDQAAFQGIHALNPLIVIDEACGVPKSIFDAVDSLATNTNARVLAIGNPTTPVRTLLRSASPVQGGT
jgi:hypothetical protein